MSESGAESSAVTCNALRWALPVCLAAYLVLAGGLAARVPINEAPDEGASLQYVRYLAGNGSLPVFTWSRGADRMDYEYHQPPLYFVLCVPGWRLLPDAARGYACRAVSLLCATGVVALVWLSAAALFPDNGELRVLATGFAALWPLNHTVGATGGNDALGGLLCSAVFYIVARATGRGWRLLDSLALGVVLGLGLLTKSTTLALFPIGVGAAWSFTVRDESRRNAARSAFVVVVAALLIGGWWLARNQRLYGDPFAARVFDLAFRHTSPRPADTIRVTHISLGGYLSALLLIMFCTTWDLFGGPNMALGILRPFSRNGPLPEVIPALPAILVCALATVAVAIGLLRWQRGARSLPASTRCALRWWWLGFVLVILAWVQFNTIQFQAQARYIYPAMLPMALGFALGWQNVFPRQAARWAATAVFAVTLCALTAWNIFGWRSLT